jgi:6-phosphogluconolactonase (cycloisomerase 2 family)
VASAGRGGRAMPCCLFAGDGDCITVYDRAQDGALLRRATQTFVGGTVRGFCFAPNGHHLYAVNTQALLSFHVAAATGDLTPTGDPVPLASPPCFVTTDRSGRHLLIASYAEPGHVSVVGIGADGVARGPPTCVLGRLRSNSHCVGTDPSNRFAFVPCVAAAGGRNGNAIHCFAFDAATGTLSENGPPIIPPPTGPTPSPRFDGPPLDNKTVDAAMYRPWCIVYIRVAHQLEHFVY